jgi:hypothetical protein
MFYQCLASLKTRSREEAEVHSLKGRALLLLINTRGRRMLALDLL